MGQAFVRSLVLLLLLAPVALAQELAPVLLERQDAGELAADAGAAAVAEFRLLNLNQMDEFHVSISTSGARDWAASAQPNAFFLGPRNETVVRVSFLPERTPHSGETFEVVFAFVNGRTGEVTRLTETVDVASAAPPRVLGVLRNPLGPPLDNAFGTFALDMAVWIGIAVASIVIGKVVFRVAMMRAQRATTNAVFAKIRRPLFLFILLLGLSRSFAILPRNPVTVFISRFLVAIAVTVFGLYVLYRVLEAGLVYYSREIAPRTANKMDDVLVPAFRKVGLIIIYVVGIILTLRTLGWDPTLVFAGAGIAGLVLAFAAQDTFSNLFSGIFLMLDRPFAEGDIILLETGEVARVESIGLRTTDLYEYDHHHVITVPNNQLATRRIVNYSAPDSNFRVDILVGVAYGSDMRKVEQILTECALEEPEVVNAPGWMPQVQLRDFLDSGMMFMLRVTLKDPRDRNRVPSRIRMAIKERFDREGIEIPFPQRVVHVRGGPLQGQG